MNTQSSWVARVVGDSGSPRIATVKRMVRSFLKWYQTMRTVRCKKRTRSHTQTQNKNNTTHDMARTTRL